MGGVGIIGISLISFFGLSFSHYLLTALQYTDISIFELEYFWINLVITVLPPLVVGLYCLLGLWEDWSIATGNGGLKLRHRLAGETALAALLLSTYFATFQLPRDGPDGQAVAAPLAGASLPLVVALGLILTLLMVGTSSAVKFAEGLDGLAAGLSVQCGLVFAFCMGGADVTSVAGLWSALAGSCLGFLAFNRHKARVFMGDAGSLALGAALAGAAILSGTIALLPFIGFIFYVELFTVILQSAWLKYSRKKHGAGGHIFHAVPLHNHLLQCGWSDWRVVLTFWAINAVTSAIGLALWKMQLLPPFP